MTISDEAVEAACEAVSKSKGRLKFEDSVRLALEAAAPILLSHERQQTADAHRDAIVNRDSVDRLEQELQQAKDEALTEAAGEYERFANEDPDAYSYTDAWTWLRNRADDIRAAGAGE